MKDESYTGLKARFRLNQKDLDHVMATVTLTASVSFWREAAKALEGKDAYGAWQVRAAIREIVSKAETEFYADVEDKKPD